MNTKGQNKKKYIELRFYKRIRLHGLVIAYRLNCTFAHTKKGVTVIYKLQISNPNDKRKGAQKDQIINEDIRQGIQTF
jgi:hypothetical protein